MSPYSANPRAAPSSTRIPDELPDGTTVRSYYLEELLAEKTRALLERTRPRDLYDVVFLLESRTGDFDLDEARGLFRGKCEVKSLAPPSSSELLAVARSAVELRSEWENMLGQQLPSLPPFEGYLSRLEAALRWIDEGGLAVPAIPAIALSGEKVESPAGVTYWGLGIPLESARYAGINRLLIEFTYKGRLRRAEPYSLRRAQCGDLHLYAWEVGSTHIKRFNVRGISDLRVTTVPFKPRYRIEFSPAGAISAPPIVRPSGGWGVRGSSRARTGNNRVYVFECMTCHKSLRHSKNDSALRAHKTPSGSRCWGRRGRLIRSE